jgi:DMSO/TMAO reductase YedYZ heme-binding membrane subunit
LVGDAGAGFFAVGVLLLIALVWMRRELVIAAFAVVVAHTLPHFLYHLTHPVRVLSSTDTAMSTGGLGLVTVVAVICLVAVARRPATAAG